MTAPIRSVTRRLAGRAAPDPARWADLRRAAEARANRATGDRPARGVTFAPGSSCIRA